jgi:hypothetical protein
MWRRIPFVQQGVLAIALLQLVCFSAAPPAVCGEAEKATPAPVSAAASGYEGKGYTIKLPAGVGKLNFADNDIQMNDCTVKVLQSAWTYKDGAIGVGRHIFTFPAGSAGNKLKASELLENFKESFFSMNKNMTPVQEKDFRVGNAPAYECRRDDSAHCRFVMIAVVPSVYLVQAQFDAAPAMLDSPEIAEYFDSFKIKK